MGAHIYGNLLSCRFGGVIIWVRSRADYLPSCAVTSKSTGLLQLGTWFSFIIFIKKTCMKLSENSGQREDLYADTQRLGHGK